MLHFIRHFMCCFSFVSLLTQPIVSKKEVQPINRDFRGNDRPRETRVNERIRAREVRLIDENGESMGVMPPMRRSEEHTSELQSHSDLVCRLLLEKKNKK